MFGVIIVVLVWVEDVVVMLCMCVVVAEVDDSVCVFLESIVLYYICDFYELGDGEWFLDYVVLVCWVEMYVVVG